MQKYLSNACTVLFFVFTAVELAGCGPSASDDKCSDANPCRKGMECNQSQACEEVPALAILTDSLPDATVGAEYRFAVRASGGIEPYTWSLESAYSWLTLDPASGVLSGTPDTPSAPLNVRVTVEDGSFGSGTSLGLDLPLSVSACVQAATRACYQPDGDICFQGVQSCNNAHWADCQRSVPSIEREHCGGDCAPCDPAISDRCFFGICRCGLGEACPLGQNCCNGQCTNPAADTGNCGGCGRDCAVLAQGASGFLCVHGSCDYTACLPGFLDCDHARANGCETPIDARHCGGCSTDCLNQLANTADSSCQAGPKGLGCVFTACLEGFGDCDSDPSKVDPGTRNGCETDLSEPVHCGSCGNDCLSQPSDRDCVIFAGGKFGCGCDSVVACRPGEQCCGQCFRADDPEHCGSCSVSCKGDPRGPACIDPATHTCGCSKDSDCGEDKLCCNRACVDIGDKHCGGCNSDCPAMTSNHVCVHDEIGGFHCGCAGAGDCEAHEQCCGGFCYPINSAGHCGSCPVNCFTDPLGSACLDPASGKCGCNRSADCRAHEYCCGGVCTPVDANNCGSCGRVCSPAAGGPRCDTASEQCYCQGPSDCNDFAGSMQTCEGSGTAGRCTCGGSAACTGTKVECCQGASGTPSCVSTDTDPENCGRCGVQCEGGPSARCGWGFHLGSCLCTPSGPGIPGIQCPAGSTATVCDINLCGCPFGPVLHGCDHGKSCCDGNAGGHGGPGGGADIGCCLGACGSNQAGECAYR